MLTYRQVQANYLRDLMTKARSVREGARLAGVHPTTLSAWLARYGIPGPIRPVQKTWRQAEDEYLREIVAATNGKVSVAARLTGQTAYRLRGILKRRNIVKPKPRRYGNRAWQSLEH